ncbi:cytochrome P450 [Amycolatopsis mediterranei S699]|uniref:Cytochrome P450 n=2 Tax=Amycolatopsis mediterranei TaxID=33910 RepID=A0A0H3DIL9_AMYMU|nr:cytochrome P450 [Amycolatopsis mediterranei U32]AEK46971.1 cytochrome P450 [Amycolatopsis mediterranei S699]AFO81686.1 cytochrome P450 [Amycolatopsis mediterranei S699]AGT88815.1 cytochrome P450 [Amycolatopsis mediterranei RB]
MPAHGEIVKLYLGPAPVYFVASPRLVHEVLVNEGPKFRKGAMFDKFRPFVGNGLVLSNGEFHLRQRRLMQPAFHRDRLTAYAEIMRRAAAEMSGSWRAGEVRQIDDDLQSLAVTIVGEALFSTELGKAAIAEARRSIYVIIQQGMIRALSPKFVEKLPVPGNRRFDEAIARMQAIVIEVIHDWRRDGTDRGDLLSTLLLAGMTDEQARDEVLTLLTAGIETTALALAWTFHELGRHPDIEARVHTELDEVLDGRPVTIDDLPRLTYVRQVVDEVLRQYPLWMLMRRTLTEVDLGGTRLPEGAEVIVSPHALHHDPTSFADPDRFDPDRWAPDRVEAIPKGAFVPFGAGNRQCIGNRFAQNEIVITVATVAACWRLVPVAGKPVRVKFTSAAYPDSLPMTAVPR